MREDSWIHRIIRDLPFVRPLIPVFLHRLRFLPIRRLRNEEWRLPPKHPGIHNACLFSRRWSAWKGWTSNRSLRGGWLLLARRKFATLHPCPKWIFVVSLRFCSLLPLRCRLLFEGLHHYADSESGFVPFVRTHLLHPIKWLLLLPESGINRSGTMDGWLFWIQSVAGNYEIWEHHIFVTLSQLEYSVNGKVLPKRAQPPHTACWNSADWIRLC